MCPATVLQCCCACVLLQCCNVVVHVPCYSVTLLLCMCPVTAKEGQLHCGEHTDYECITLLFQDDVGGLQVNVRTVSTAQCSPDGLFNPLAFILFSSKGKREKGGRGKRVAEDRERE